MLRVNDINFEEKTLYMWTLKRKKARRYQRLVYVNEATLELIREYMGVYRIKNGVLFSLSDRRIRDIVLEAGIRAGIPRVGEKAIHPHHMRHSHAVAWIRNNPDMASLRKLQKRLGHASLNTTAFYLEYSKEENQAEAESALGSMFPSKPKESYNIN